MKKIYLLLILLISATSVVSAKRAIERTYLSTDKNAYVAGETMWISAFCLDISEGEKILSDLSSVLYIEMHSSAGVVLTTKIALAGGRGSGRIIIPAATPTGNYKLVSYTKQMLNEKHPPLSEKTVSVYNTLSQDRTPESVVITSDSIWNKPIIKWPASRSEYDLQILKAEFTSSTFKPGESVSFKLSNSSATPVTMSVSIAKADILPVYEKNDIVSFINVNKKSLPKEMSNNFVPEYEGEIIKGKISSSSTNNSFVLTKAFLSVPGGNAEIYTSEADSNGIVSFFTNNIYGNREVVLEVSSNDTTSSNSLELIDPFLRPVLSSPVPLYLSPEMESILKERSIGMQIGKSFGVDSLYEISIPKFNPLLGIKKKEYLLDDYTRFPVMEEVIIEYITELRYRKSANKVDLQVRWESAFNSLAYSKDNTLALIDGIPVFDHKKILEYDPLKIKSLTIYGGIYYIGNVSYTGIVALNSYKGDYPGLTFNRSVRILDYNGVQYPSKFSGKAVSEGSNLPDFRHTLYWDPIVNIGEEKTVSVNFNTPDYSGKFILSVEGVDEKGLPFVYTREFMVE